MNSVFGCLRTYVSCVSVFASSKLKMVCLEPKMQYFLTRKDQKNYFV